MLKDYTVSLTLTIKGVENKEEAFKEYLEKVKAEDFDHDNIDIEEEGE